MCKDKRKDCGCNDCQDHEYNNFVNNSDNNNNHVITVRGKTVQRVRTFEGEGNYLVPKSHTFVDKARGIIVKNGQHGDGDIVSMPDRGYSNLIDTGSSLTPPAPTPYPKVGSTGTLSHGPKQTLVIPPPAPPVSSGTITLGSQTTTSLPLTGATSFSNKLGTFAPPTKQGMGVGTTPTPSPIGSLNINVGSNPILGVPVITPVLPPTDSGLITTGVLPAGGALNTFQNSPDAPAGSSGGPGGMPSGDATGALGSAVVGNNMWIYLGLAAATGLGIYLFTKKEKAAA